jgi:large subunit ribosomal protein L24
MNTLHVKKGDSVIVLFGNEKGKTGKVMAVFPKLSEALVEGIGMKKRSQKPKRQGVAGQIVDKQYPVHTSKLMKVEDHKKRAEKAKKNTKAEKPAKAAKTK